MTKKADAPLAPVRFNVTQAALAKMESECKAFTVPTNPTEYKALTEQIAYVRTTRTAIEKRRKEKNAPVLAWQRGLKAAADGLINTLKNIENPLLTLKKEYDDEKDRARREKEEAEEARMEALREKVRQIHAYRHGITLSHTSEQIGELLDFVRGVEIDEDVYQDLYGEAFAAQQETQRFLTTRLNEIEKKEAEDEERRLAQIELDRVAKDQEEQRKAMAEQQEKLDKQQREIDEKREAADVAEKERLQKIEDEKQEAIEDEKRKKFEAEEKVRLVEEEKLRVKNAKAEKLKKTAYRKKLNKDLPNLKLYLEAVAGLPRPDLKTDEAGWVVSNLNADIEAAMAAMGRLVNS